MTRPPPNRKRNGEATQRDAIRAALRAAKRPLDIYELWQAVEEELRTVVGKGRLYAKLAVMQTLGEIVTTGRADTRRDALKTTTRKTR